MVQLQIDPAQPEHVAGMVALSEQKRSEYAAHQPRFWRKAADAAAAQTPYFHDLLARPNIVARVAWRDAPEAILGFVIAAVVPAPAVYDPGGLTCLVDDFCVAEPALWPSVGAALLEQAFAAAAALGAVQSVVVCGHRDEPKRALLRGLGLSIASEWYTGPIQAAPQA